MPALGVRGVREALAAARLAGEINRATVETIRTGRNFDVQCLSCGNVFRVTVGGALPVGAVVIAGECTSTPQGTNQHRPEVWWQGSRIR